MRSTSCTAREYLQSLKEANRSKEPQCLATDGIEVRKPVEYVILKICVRCPNCEELLPEPLLSLGVVRKSINDARKSVAGCVRAGNEEGIDLCFKFVLGEPVLSRSLIVLVHCRGEIGQCAMSGTWEVSLTK